MSVAEYALLLGTYPVKNREGGDGEDHTQRHGNDGHVESLESARMEDNVQAKKSDIKCDSAGRAEPLRECKWGGVKPEQAVRKDRFFPMRKDNAAFVPACASCVMCVCVCVCIYICIYMY